ncbi:hypothetical protein [Curtobacterium sp. MCBD17_030]|uniref:hypothetical protein n=1 Tax=Curtobacterium sp. MCBD17_030 TaxID=2175649 RepID=UPI000D959D36|nr:hypothetical protein [Curtobacterium sp. MCBD17_030]PYY32260.1 hypothetical protein DEI89_13620 [Curtobacterium sp. MCBD17_030]
MTDYAELDRQWSRMWGRAFPDVNDLAAFYPERQLTTNAPFADVLAAVGAGPDLVAFTTIWAHPQARGEEPAPPLDTLDRWEHTGTERNARGLADSFDAHFWVTTEVSRSSLPRIAAACDEVIITDHTCSWALAPLHADSELFIAANLRDGIADELGGVTPPPLAPATLLPASERQAAGAPATLIPASERQPAGAPGRLDPDAVHPAPGAPTMMRTRDKRGGIDVTTVLDGPRVTLPAAVFKQAPHYDLCESARGFNGLDGDPGPCDCWKSYARPVEEQS